MEAGGAAEDNALPSSAKLTAWQVYVREYTTQLGKLFQETKPYPNKYMEVVQMPKVTSKLMSTGERKGLKGTQEQAAVCYRNMTAEDKAALQARTDAANKKRREAWLSCKTNPKKQWQAARHLIAKLNVLVSFFCIHRIRTHMCFL